MSSDSEFNIGDLVRLRNSYDKQRELGIILNIKEKVHLRSAGTAAVVVVYWFTIQESDWEYTFFLEKISD